MKKNEIFVRPIVALLKMALLRYIGDIFAISEFVKSGF